MQAKIWLVVAGIAAAGVAAAAEAPQVEYSADSYMESADGTMQGKVYSAPGKERHGRAERRGECLL